MNKEEQKQVKVVIIGGGESGVGTALLAQKQGYDVFVSDFGIIKAAYKKELSEHQISWEEKGHTIDEILSADVVVKSPGIPDVAPVLVACRKQGIEVISEIDFALKFFAGELIAITGSNGKTTTTTLTHYILKEDGRNVGVGGNIGVSFARQVAEEICEEYVLEVSSFQLDDTQYFAPHIAVITTLSPDHLDRYDYDEQKYYDSKFKIVKHQKSTDYFIYDADNEHIIKGIEKHKPKSILVPFSINREIKGQGAFMKSNKIFSQVNQETMVLPVEDLGISGKHNVKNAMAASLVAQIKNVRNDTLRNSMKKFEGVSHRLERVIKKNGVCYINDSKATNVDSAFYALEGVSKPTVWIVGGVESGNDYERLLPFVHEKVKAIICLGVDNEKIKKQFERVVPILVEAKSMEQAVQYAHRISEEGDTVLLSPACKSFDLFESYEDRGNQFKACVMKL